MLRFFYFGENCTGKIFNFNSTFAVIDYYQFIFPRMVSPFLFHPVQYFMP